MAAASFLRTDGTIPMTATSSGTAMAAAHQYFLAAEAGSGFMRGIIPPSAGSRKPALWSQAALLGRRRNGGVRAGRGCPDRDGADLAAGRGLEYNGPPLLLHRIKVMIRQHERHMTLWVQSDGIAGQDRALVVVDDHRNGCGRRCNVCQRDAGRESRSLIEGEHIGAGISRLKRNRRFLP